MGRIGCFGARVTGAKAVTQQCYNAHVGGGAPQDCTVRYVRANPRVSEIVAIGANTNPFRLQCVKLILCWLFGLLFSSIWLIYPL